MSPRTPPLIPPVEGLNSQSASPPRQDPLEDSPPSRAMLHSNFTASDRAPMSPVAFDTAVSHLSLKEQMQLEQIELQKNQLSARGESSVTFSTTSSTSSGAITQRRSLPGITVETENGTSSTIQPKSTNPDFIASEQMRLKNSFRYVREYISPKYRQTFTRDRYKEFRRTYRVFDRDEDGIVTAADLSSFMQWGEQKTVDISRMMTHLYGSEQMTFPQFIDLMMENEYIFEEYLNGTRSLKSIEKLSMGMYGGMKTRRKRGRRNKYMGRKHGLVMTREDLQVIKQLKEKQKSKETISRKRKVRQQVMKRLIPEKRVTSRPSGGSGTLGDEDFFGTHAEDDDTRIESPQRRPNTVGANSRNRLTTATRRTQRQNGSRPQTTPFHLRPSRRSLLSTTAEESTYAPKLYNSTAQQRSPSPISQDINPFAVPVQESRLYSVYAPGGTSLLASTASPQSRRRPQTSPFHFRTGNTAAGSKFPLPRAGNTRLKQLSKRGMRQASAEHQSPQEHEDGFDTERRRQFYANLRQNNPYVPPSQDATFKQDAPQGTHAESTTDILPPRRRRSSQSSIDAFGRRPSSSLKITSARRLAMERYEMTPTPELMEKPVVRTVNSSGIV